MLFSKDNNLILVNLILAIVRIQGWLCKPMHQSLLKKEVKVGSNTNGLMDRSYNERSDSELEPIQRNLSSRIKPVDDIDKNSLDSHVEGFFPQYSSDALRGKNQVFKSLPQKMEESFAEPVMKLENAPAWDKSVELEGKLPRQKWEDYGQSMWEFFDNIFGGRLTLFSKSIGNFIRNEDGLFSEYFYTNNIEEEKSIHHLNMHHIYDTNDDLEKSQQDYIFFSVTMSRYETEAVNEIWKDSPITGSFSKPMIDQINFMRKLRRFIVRQSKDGDADEASKKKFFLEVKYDLMRMRNFFIDPSSPAGYKIDEVLPVIHLWGDALKFIHHRLGSDYLKEPGFKMYNEDTADFEFKYQLYQLLNDNVRWSKVILNYSSFSAKSLKKIGNDHDEELANINEKTARLYWKSINENVETYTRLKTEHTKKFEEISSFSFYRILIYRHDNFIKLLPILEKRLKPLIRNPEN